MRRAIIIFAAVANLVLVDALVKRIAEVFWKKAPAFSVIPGIFDLSYVENHGCAWGMLRGQEYPLAIFGIVALAFLIWKRRTVFAGSLTAEILLYAGIIGNVIDRLFRGYVIDMFDFHWGIHHFPCFNVADSCITVAVGLMLIMSFFEKGRVK